MARGWGSSHVVNKQALEMLVNHSISKLHPKNTVVGYFIAILMTLQAVNVSPGQ